jgi:hypothetical protein
MTTKKPEVDYSKFTKDELFALLCPPAPEVTERDVRLARGRYVMNEFIYDMMTVGDALRILANRAAAPGEVAPAEDDETKKKNDEKVKWAQNILDRFYDRLDTPDDEVDPWDAFAGHFDKYHKDGLTSMHGGDCTAFACTCERCYAEDLFDVPSTATWGGKHAGHRLYGAYSRRADAEKAAKAALDSGEVPISSSTSSA